MVVDTLVKIHRTEVGTVVSKVYHECRGAVADDAISTFGIFGHHKIDHITVYLGWASTSTFIRDYTKDSESRAELTHDCIIHLDPESTTTENNSR